MKKFVNISNHPKASWPQAELDEAAGLVDGGEVVDLAMPAILPTMSDSQLREIARDIAGTAQTMGAGAAMVAGEYSATILIISELEARGIPCFFGMSERVAREVPREDGLVDIIHTFEFRGFRKAPEIRLA